MAFLSNILTRIEARIAEFYIDATKDPVSRFKELPIDERTKKHLLAKYFQSEEGQEISRAVRREMYDELLGREVNQRMRG